MLVVRPARRCLRRYCNREALAGAPVSWLIGGNPFLGAVWLFANGVICFHEGYKFFMIALADQEEVNRVVREIKGLLPRSNCVSLR